ncbi:TPR repeat-containing protein C19B12.01 [Choanephora cucurbitarum]|uniref:TPR repeat-containing protein C19B12.01 n=1 Tax=Choanephora cucurbitarum TaxID=101091 RepID=A0A1C7NRM3_9FUNG|nr:TPR repeat-containing protein C19B12.01 [Choanephora cucurbitarum]
MTLSNAEVALVLGRKVTVDNEIISTIIADIQEGRYAKVIKESIIFKDAQASSEELKKTGDIQAWIDNRLSSIALDNEQDLFYVLATGIASLNSFIQVNWTGPVLAFTVSELFFGQENQEFEDVLHKACLKSLSVDSEEVYHLTQQLALLAIARTLFEAVRTKNLTGSFWCIRSAFIQQQLLDEFTGSLQNKLTSLAQESNTILEKTPESEIDAETRQALKVRHELEIGLIHSFFGQDKESLEKLESAQKESGFTWSLTGALGRRTKFQQFDVSQLVVLAESKKKADGSPIEVNEDAAKPETLDLNDDTLLDNIQFTENEKNTKENDQRHGNLEVIDQCLLLAFCLNVKNTNPDHGITTEQMVPYVTRVLENANNWMVHTMGLLLRSRLEANKNRTVERAALQLQALVDQIKVEDSGVEERLAYFYDLLLPSKWEMERELARRFVSLGVLRSAVEIFERLEMWEDVISCYQMMEQPQKAKDVLTRLMEENPQSPKYWCILGDLEAEPAHWRKSWEMSNQKYARAMRSLGSYEFKRKNYESAIECYQKALTINPLFEGSWYILGCAAMMTENWEVGSRAFQRVVSLDDEQPEAWTNLASIYIKMDRKPDAFLALKQATKLKFDNWKIWQNLLFVSIDVGQFPDAIYAMQRVVELRWDKDRDEAVDVGVLRMIVESVVQNWKDPFDRDGARLSRHVQRLLENVILSRITNSPDIWMICAKYYLWQQRYVDALETSVKAYRSVMHDPRIETEESIFEDVTTVALETVDMYENLGQKTVDGAPVCADWRYQSRLIIKGLMGKVRDIFEDTTSYERLKDRLEDLKNA